MEVNVCDSAASSISERREMHRTVPVGNIDETTAQTYLLQVPHAVRHAEQLHPSSPTAIGPAHRPSPEEELNRTVRKLLALLGPLLLVLLGGAVFEGTASAAAPP
jgi:hypothetical protein